MGKCAKRNLFLPFIIMLLVRAALHHCSCCCWAMSMYHFLCRAWSPKLATGTWRENERVRLNKIHFDNLFIENRKILCRAHFCLISTGRFLEIEYFLLLFLDSGKNLETIYSTSNTECFACARSVFWIYRFLSKRNSKQQRRNKTKKKTLENLPEKDINWIRSILQWQRSGARTTMMPMNRGKRSNE